MVACCLVAACHSTPYDFTYTLGPNGTGSDVLLTYNPEPDYWPTWTGDSTGILYAYQQLGNAAQNNHRCMGVMPAGGGQRYWEWCDDAAGRADSLSSFPAFAMAANGRLIYLESAVSVQFPFDTARTALWLADSAFPYQRQRLATFPITVGDSTVNWLGDLTWTGPNTFLALGQRLILMPHCVCPLSDSSFAGEWVIRGTISSTGATLEPVEGTSGATGYSLAENGASIVFTQLDNTNLMKVPAAGGSATVAALATPRANVQLMGVSCRSSSCIVAVGPVLQGAGAYELRRVPLSGDTAMTVLTRGQPLADPILSPTGTIVATFGVMFGHLRTDNSTAVDLHLYTPGPSGIVP